jgi:hypothetical protein
MAFNSVIYFYGENSSSMFSQTIIVLTSLALNINIFLGIGIYFLTSFLKVHAGSIFPSDILTCLPLIVFNQLVVFEIPLLPIWIIFSMLEPFSLWKLTPFWTILCNGLTQKVNLENKLKIFVMVCLITNFFISSQIGDGLVGRRTGAV